MKYSLAILSLGALLASGCGTTDPATAKRIAELEARLETLEKAPKAQPMAPGKKGPRPPQPAANPEEENKASAILKEANGLAVAGDTKAALAKIDELQKQFPATRSARSAGRMKEELSVVGVDAGKMEVEKWFQGDVDLNGGKATFLVFWEVWCPHCKREVPRMEATHQKYKDKGFQVVGLTKMTRNITEEQINSFLSENKVSYPVAKEAGMAMSKRFGVKGIPAAAVVKGGKVVWRGHPAKVTDAMIEGWIN